MRKLTIKEMRDFTDNLSIFLKEDMRFVYYSIPVFGLLIFLETILLKNYSSISLIGSIFLVGFVSVLFIALLYLNLKVLRRVLTIKYKMKKDKYLVEDCYLKNIRLEYKDSSLSNPVVAKVTNLNGENFDKEFELANIVGLDKMHAFSHKYRNKKCALIHISDKINFVLVKNAHV